MPYALTIVMPAFNEEGNIDRQDPALRRFVSGVFNGLSSLVFGMSVRDLNCSFKLFRREVLAGASALPAARRSPVPHARLGFQAPTQS